MVAIRTLVADTDSVNGASCRFQCNESILVHNHEVANHLYRIAQEAVQNALRHGQPREVIVSLTRSGDQVMLEVQDDGSGFDPRKPVSDGIGLNTMKYRAAVMNGILDFLQPAGGGTLVRCSVPDPQPAP